MGRFADGPEHGTVAGETVLIAALALTWLEQHLEVVEHQQIGSIPQELEQCRDPRRLALGCDHLLVREEADRVAKQLTDRWRIAQTAPVRPLKGWRHVLGQPRGERCLADATDAQHAYYSTMLP